MVAGQVSDGLPGEGVDPDGAAGNATVASAVVTLADLADLADLAGISVGAYGSFACGTIRPLRRWSIG